MDMVRLYGADLRGAALNGVTLVGADLRLANLEGTDLRGALMGMSAWPLWSGSVGVVIGANTLYQLIYYLVNVKVIDDGVAQEFEALKKHLEPLAERYLELR